MWMRLTLDEARGILHYVGVLLLGLAGIMCVPFVTALVFAEWGPLADYALGVTLTAACGAVLVVATPRPSELGHRQALIISALAWIVASAAGAVPLVLSGHYASYLDALFETVSGFTTSGLTLTGDLDHLANAHNMWRHLTHLIGGQGIIVAAVSLAVGLKGGAFSLYLAEGRDEKILPNVVHTARFIWFVTAVWVGFGTIALTVSNLFQGMPFDRSFLHAFWNTAACFDTGGFGPQSQNALYYHNPWFQFITLVLMLAGTFNFNLHADLWRGDARELRQNLEVKTLAWNLIILSAFTALGLAATEFYAGTNEILSKGVYHIISANSGTGQQAIHALQWPDLGAAAFYSVILAMAFGGMVSSTAGGIKALRIGLIAKSIMLNIRRSIAPPSAVVTEHFHHIRKRQVKPEIVVAALMTFTLYIFTYLTGGLIGAAYGHSLENSLFESVSAAANVGLTTGITHIGMPVGLRILYIVQMWAGRLEFFTLLALLAVIVASIMPKRVLR